MSEPKFTQGEWTVKDADSAGLEIFAEVNLGKDENGGVLQPIYNVGIRPSLMVDKNGKVTMMIAYESWRQFPSINFQEMQKANANLIAAAPDMYEALKLLQSALTEYQLRDVKKRYSLCVADAAASNALAKAEGKHGN